MNKKSAVIAAGLWLRERDGMTTFTVAQTIPIVKIQVNFNTRDVKVGPGQTVTLHLNAP